MNTPNPALVSQRAVQPLSRIALWLLCAAYVLPGVFGRDPWKNADITAVGYMLELARGESSWMAPTIVGVSSDGSLLPYWIGALSVQLLGSWIDPSVAARLPFVMMLAGTLALVWYATLHLARTEAAQPLPFAFGGEANPQDYARAIADGSVLAMMSALGLLQLGHETTPELVQLLGVASFLYALSAGQARPLRSRAGLLLSLPVMAASGAATTALIMGVAGTWICFRSGAQELRRLLHWTLAACVLAAAIASALGAWAWRISSSSSPWSMVRLLVWFAWPVWVLAAWTLWKWRRHLLKRHIAVPAAVGLVAIAASLAMGASDRALMLALPALAVLAAFALPTLRRGMGAAIDWFSVFFFSALALTIWVLYIALQAGVPPKIAANIAKLAPGFEAPFQPVPLALALLGSIAWLALVRWRTSRQQHALWKSLVLPASGVALNWLLLMSLGLPLLDHARSYRPLVERISRTIPPGDCVSTDAMTRSQLAAMTVHGKWHVTADMDDPSCRWLVVAWRDVRGQRFEPPERPGWDWVMKIQRPTDKVEAVLIYRR